MKSSRIKLEGAAALLILVAMVVSCFQTRSNSNEDTDTRPTPAPTATSTPLKGNSVSLVLQDPGGQYELVETMFYKELTGAPITIPDSGGFDLEDCWSASNEIGVAGDDPLHPLTELAYKMVRLRVTLPKLGYPSRVWEPTVTSYEQEELRIIVEQIRKGKYREDSDGSSFHARNERQERFRNVLVRELDDYRRIEAPTLPEVVYIGECGAGEVTVYIKSEPPNGRVRLIPVFFYELCKAQNLDPEDQTACSRWKEAAKGVAMRVSGDYFYRANWPDTAEQGGRIGFDIDQDGKTIVFEKQ